MRSTVMMLVHVLALWPLALALYNVEPEHTFTTGVNFYRVLTLDESTNSLFVGAMNNIYRLNMFNINDTSATSYKVQSVEPMRDALMRCRYRSDDPDIKCQNHVKLIIKRSDGSIYTCGSNAYDPKVRILDAATLKIRQDDINGAAVCHVDPAGENAAVWVESGNPDNVPSIYSATVTDFTQTNKIIYRPAIDDVKHPFMRTLHTDHRWLSDPTFVHAFERGAYVYIFFRESSIEQPGAVYSRIARICKTDRGGQQVLNQNWATFIKARLNCSLPGYAPFYFDELQSMYRVTDGSDSIFYGTFTTSRRSGPFSGSAICSFSLSAIDSMLDTGALAEQPDAQAQWLRVPPEVVPLPRPGQCIDDTQSLTDTQLHYIKNHLMVYDAISARESEPYVLTDVRLRHIFVDELKDNVNVIWATSDESRLYKIKEEQDKDKFEHHLLAVYNLGNDVIRDVALLKNEFLYYSTDSRVTQLSLNQCSAHTSCVKCATDPYCSWSLLNSRCSRRHNIHEGANDWVTSRDVMTSCGGVMATQRIISLGDATLLECVDGGLWRHKGVTIDTSRVTQKGALVIINATHLSEGDYECTVEGRQVSRINIRVDSSCDDSPKTPAAFASVYRQWCREFHNYQSTMHQWRQWYTDNAQCANSPNFQLLSGNRIQR